MMSASSDGSSDSGGWIDVESDGEDHLSLSDSGGEDEKGKAEPLENDGPVNDANRTSALATTKVRYTYLLMDR
jgi:protein SDA1